MSVGMRGSGAVRGAGSVTWLLAVGLAGLGIMGIAACEGSSEPTGPGAEAVHATPRVGPDVSAAVAGAGGARVVVALELPAERAGHPGGAGGADAAGGAGADGADGERERGVPDVAGLEQRVRSLTDAFLDRAGADLGEVRRFATVSALVGTVSSEVALARLAADPAVVRIDLDVGGRGGLAASVPLIGADVRRARGNDGAGVVMAILDTGVERANPSLQGRVVDEACFGGGGETAFCPDGGTRQTGAGAAADDAGHGTHVAGILASSGAEGSPGVAPGASLVAVKVLDDCAFSGCFYAFSEIVAALDYLIVNHERLGVRVVNMSLGTSTLFDGVCDGSAAYNVAGGQAARTLRDLGVVVVAAAMNNGSRSQMASPACLGAVVAVGATDSEDQVAGISNVNAETDVLAPGVSILSLARGGGTRSATGTSMAAPHVAGCAALIAQTAPWLTAGAIIQRLRTSPVQITVPGAGVFPRLDCQPDLETPDPRGTVTVERPTAP